MQNSKKLFLKIVTGLLISSLGIATVCAAALTALTGLSDTMSSLKLGAVSNHSFVFTTPSGLGNGSTTVITFPSEFGIPSNLDFNDVDINVGGAYTGSTTLAAVPTGTTLGVVRTSSTTLTITASSSAVITPASTVYIRIGTNALWNGTVGTHQIINATNTTGIKAIGIAGTMWDSGTTTVNILTNDTVAVNAVVPQALTFSISSYAINFGDLTGTTKYASSTGSSGDTIDTVAHTLAVSTNAPSGYTITVRGQMLTSQQNITNTIDAIGATPATSNNTIEQFGIYATKAGGSNGTIAVTYASSTPSKWGYNATATTSDTLASGTSATVTETYSLHYIANVSPITEAGTYSANIVYVGTSNF